MGQIFVPYITNFKNIQLQHTNKSFKVIIFSFVGRKTFPRARRTQGTSFRSPVSFSPTDHSLSTSSGSSIFTPEYDDSRIRRRGSDIDNPTLTVMDISPPSRCK